MDRIPIEGLHQRNVCEDRRQTPQILVIWSVENVADPTRGVKLSREAVRRINPRCKSTLLPGLLLHCLHRIIPHWPRAPCVFRAALHMVAAFIKLLPTRAQTLLFRLRRKKGGRSEPREVRPRQTPLLERQRVLPSSDGVKRSHGMRADCELNHVDAGFDQGLIQRGSHVQSLVTDRHTELHARLEWRRHTLQRLNDPGLLVEAKLTDGTLLPTDLAPRTLTGARVQAIVCFLLLHLSRPAPSTHLRQTPSGVGIELHSKRVQIAEAGRGRRLPRTGFSRQTWRWSACLQTLITLPTPDVEELLVGLRELLQKPRVGLKGRALEVTQRLI